MNQHWNVNEDYLKIEEMPYYWRLSNSGDAVPGISPRLPIKVVTDSRFDYLRYDVEDREWDVIEASYKKNENIGHLNEGSGQLQTYGSSVNRFFLESVAQFSPRNIYEIGCGAGYSIKYLKDNGWSVVGVDPSEYSLRWSRELGFALLNDFFREGLLGAPADFIYCNDVFEHVRNVDEFSAHVYESLAKGGVFCFATTNSTNSISVGDISMLEHQHVNMFTERSIYQILRSVGFSNIDVKSGAYGNTFHVVAQKGSALNVVESTSEVSCEGFFDRAKEKLSAFEVFYGRTENLHCYVPLRCMSYLASVGDFGNSPIYDSNIAWRGKYFDGYSQSILAPDDIAYDPEATFFIGSLTFHDEIRQTLIAKGFLDNAIYSINDLS